MFISSLLLAISSSIDSLGIGVTYGLKRIKLKKCTKLILFFISIFITLLSAIVSNLFKSLFGELIFKSLGSIILIFMGLIILFKTDSEEHTFDLDNSNDIDNKEAILLGIALSLDSFCIGVSAISLGINMLLFAITVAFFQFIFLSLGNFLGIHLLKLKKAPQSIWSTISGILLILIGIFKF